MNTKRLLFNASLIVVMACQFMQIAEGKDLTVSVVSTKLEALSKQLSSGEVASVEIVWMDPTAVMSIPLSPESLDVSYDLKLKIEKLPIRSKLTRELIQAIKNTAIVHYDKKWEEDVRWRVKFFAQNDDHTIVTLYFSGGSYKGVSLGVVDGNVVYFKNGLYRWLTSNFLSSFNHISR
ncbi:hypothetical protein H8L32_16570 [Undibacterium sp. CY18W]|uniref:Uncharacterized protein n=1 Tax=Undibacterium hunanense TaxID=2762292 RepID=A0ABR6ZT90_9BURK|nr:hypothetical protein [Undibacterium hunanense]MBC3919107.1 hypothetical protein [Undibacterium hunanense]